MQLLDHLFVKLVRRLFGNRVKFSCYYDAALQFSVFTDEVTNKCCVCQHFSLFFVIICPHVHQYCQSCQLKLMNINVFCDDFLLSVALEECLHMCIAHFDYLLRLEMAFFTPTNPLRQGWMSFSIMLSRVNANLSYRSCVKCMAMRQWREASQ